MSKITRKTGKRTDTKSTTDLKGRKKSKPAAGATATKIRVGDRVNLLESIGHDRPGVVIAVFGRDSRQGDLIVWKTDDGDFDSWFSTEMRIIEAAPHASDEDTIDNDPFSRQYPPTKRSYAFAFTVPDFDMASFFKFGLIEGEPGKHPRLTREGLRAAWLGLHNQVRFHYRVKCAGKPCWWDKLYESGQCPCCGKGYRDMHAGVRHLSVVHDIDPMDPYDPKKALRIAKQITSKVESESRNKLLCAIAAKSAK